MTQKHVVYFCILIFNEFELRCHFKKTLGLSVRLPYITQPHIVIYYH